MRTTRKRPSKPARTTVPKRLAYQPGGERYPKVFRRRNGNTSGRSPSRGSHVVMRELC